MKQFQKILEFELKNYMKNKGFVGFTILLVAVIAVIMFFPRFVQVDQKDAQKQETEDLPVMLIAGENKEETAAVMEAFSAVFTDYEVKAAGADVENVKKQIIEGEAECAFLMDGLTSYTYYVDNLSMYDKNAMTADEVLRNLYRMDAMVGNGFSAEEANAVLNAEIKGTTEKLGKDQGRNFFYAYIMIFTLYMVILLYGQMVTTNVATEKSSRAMELLITSAKPASMMFGKVIASCIAGFVQIFAIFGSALLFYNMNKSYWGVNEMVRSLVEIPVDLFIYMLVFFVLGFLVYAFLFGAVGSTVSKLEDVNTAVMPLTLLFIAGFFVVIFSMSSGSFDTALIKVCSFIPFTSPMAMFTRIAMTAVPVYEIVISIVILTVSVVGIGIVSAKIYRAGVLMYGTPPKLGAIIKAIRKA